MTFIAEPSSTVVESRARRSGGTSADAIYEMVVRAIRPRHPGGGVLLDVGCGTGNLWRYSKDLFDRYQGADVVRYDGFPDQVDFVKVDLDTGRVPLPDSSADVVASVETIEHLENPRAFTRELTRLTKPGGWVVITTPNQLSLLSKVTLLLLNEFNAFRAESYPAHLTALLEVDLRRIATECGLVDVAICYSECGRIIGTSMHFPGVLSRAMPRLFSDNLLLVGKRSDGTA